MSSSKSSRNNFLVQGGILAIASIVVRLIGILYRIPMVRYIGDEGSGYYSVAFNIYNIALILSSYSLPLAVSKLVAARNVKKEYKNSYRIFTAAMRFAVVSGLVSAGVIFFGADYIATKLYKMPQVAFPLRILAPTLFVFAVMGVLRGFYQGKNTMLPTAFSQVLEQIVNAVVSVTGAYYFMKMHDASQNIAAYGAAGGTLGTLTGALSGLLFLGFIFMLYRPTLKRQMKRDRRPNVDSYKVIYQLLWVTIIPVILSQTVYQISGFLDDVIFSNVLNAKGVTKETYSAWLGVYGNKYRLLTNVPIAISSALASSMIPSIVASRSIGANSEVKDKIHIAIKSNMIIAFPCAIGMSVLASPIIQLVFPGSKPLASNLLIYGSIAVVFYALSTISNAVLQAVNLMRVPVINASISLAIHIVLLIGLLRFTDLGAYALMIGNVTFPLVICILNWIRIGKELLYKQEITKTFVIPLISSLIMGVGAMITYNGVYFLIRRNSLATIVAILIAVVIYFVAVIALKGVTREELYALPKGKMIVRLANKLHLI
ncbi:stage V sporulation protein B [Lachnospiraceae bacterium KM106-2]|nr:stage V sporulation protein B [Lachnospiraceae bacterium KM106-2]